MGLWDDVKKDGMFGLAVGIAAAIPAPIQPVLTSIAKPLAKGDDTGR
jgi:hypothetical protein